MRILLFLLASCLFILPSKQALAQLAIVDFNYTGHSAIEYSSGWYEGVSSTVPLLFVGGPSHDTFGTAFEFYIPEKVAMSSLVISADLFSPYDWSTPTTASFGIYSGSSYFWMGDSKEQPVPATVAAGSLFPTSFDYVSDGGHIDVSVPIKYVFDTGYYWLGIHGVGGTSVMATARFVDPPIERAVAVPEPPSLLLMMVGGIMIMAISYMNILVRKVADNDWSK